MHARILRAKYVVVVVAAVTRIPIIKRPASGQLYFFQGAIHAYRVPRVRGDDVTTRHIWRVSRRKRNSAALTRARPYTPLAFFSSISAYSPFVNLLNFFFFFIPDERMILFPFQHLPQIRARARAHHAERRLFPFLPDREIGSL